MSGQDKKPMSANPINYVRDYAAFGGRGKEGLCVLVHLDMDNAWSVATIVRRWTRFARCASCECDRCPGNNSE